jgi:hypothetical protein
LPVEGVYSVEEQRELVYQYLSVPYGGKGRFLAEHGVPYRRMRRWRAQVFAGTLEHGLVPRAEGLVSVEESGALARLLAENRALREEIAAQKVEHQRQLDEREEELGRQRRAVDALGKAIEILHPSGASKNSEPDAPPDAQHPGQPDQQPDQQ